MKRASTLFFALALWGSLEAQENPRYTLRIDAPCGEAVVGPPGALWDDGTGGSGFFFNWEIYSAPDRHGIPAGVEVPNNRPGQSWDIVLETRENPYDYGGAYAWLFGLGVEPSSFDNVAIPAVVFTDPEVAWCGLTESRAAEEGIEVEVGRFPWAASGRALTLGRPEGLTKLIIDPDTKRVLGMGVVGSGAGELIAEGVLAVETAAVARDVAESIHAHPTLSETVMEAAELLLGGSTHVYRPKRR